MEVGDVNMKYWRKGGGLGYGGGDALAWVRLRVLGIPGAVPLSLQKNAKGGEKVTQLACGSNKCHFFSNAFSRALRGSHAPEIRHPDPDPGQR